MKSSDRIVSKRYAKAFSLLSKDINLLKDSFAILKEIRKAIRPADDILNNPTVSKQAKISFLQDVLKNQDEEIKNFILVLSVSKRYYLFDIILEDIENIIYEKQGIVRAEIETAYILSHEQKQQIKNRLEKYLNKKIETNFQINKNLILGFKAKAQDLLIDASLLNSLKELKEDLKEEEVYD